jgi:hypothetical protein
VIRRLAAGLTAAYVVAAVADLLVAATSPEVLAGLHRAAAGAAARLVVALVAVAVLFHATDGAGRAAGDLWPAVARHRAGVEAGARFVTLAAGVPVAAAVLWPAVTAWFVR